MKKWLLSFAALATLSACSVSNETKQAANDSYMKNADQPVFAKLETGGVTILGQDNSYQLPTDTAPKTEGMDIRPPSTPLALIGNSVTQFNGEGSLIIYPADKRDVYNLEQVKRLLSEQGISYKAEGEQLETDWAPTGRADDVGNTQIRYLIEEAGNANAHVLGVSIIEMKRNNIIFTPSVKDKERYTSDRLNQLVGELNAAYRSQMQQVATTEAGAVQSALIMDHNQHMALAMNVNFRQAWQKLGEVLPQLGFEMKEEIAGRGYRLMKYKPVDATEWARFGVTQPELEKGEYHMQLSAYGNESAVVISNEDKESLNGASGEAVYQALQNLIAK